MHDRRLRARLVHEPVHDLPHAPRRVERQRAHHVDDADPRPVAPRRRSSSPRPGASDERFAGRTTRSEVARYGAISCRRQVWLPSVIASAPAASSRSASFGVMPTPSATFSPLTMQTAASCSSRRRGETILERLSPGPADDVADEEDVQGSSDPAAGCTSMATLLPRARACLASACRSTAATSTTVPSLDDDASTGLPTASDGIRLEVGERDDQRRCCARPHVDPRPVRLAVDHEVGDRDHGPVDRGVDVRAGRRPRRRGPACPGPPSSWIPDRAVLGEPAIRRQSRASSPSLTWRPTGRSSIAPPSSPWNPIAVTASPATGSLIWRLPTVASTSGSGGTPLRRPAEIDGRRDRLGRSRAERGQDQRDEGEGGDDPDHGQAAGAMLSAPPSCAVTSRSP